MAAATMKAVTTQAIWSGAAENAPCMWGMAIPAPKAKYALPTRWQVIKGHKPKKGEASQYRKIARTLVNSPWFRANDFGWGDENIREIATGRLGKKGNNTDWVAYSTQIHLAMTVKQLAVAVHAASAVTAERDEAEL